ncbi:MAG: hypothetical protein EXS09_10300 [Gemmataceae bacterium]|nr:hypothetical protein [Gemmataceae bacterium]
MEDIKLLHAHPECAPPVYPAFLQGTNGIPTPTGDPQMGKPATNPAPTNGILPPPKTTIPPAPSGSRTTKPADLKSPALTKPFLPSLNAHMPSANPTLSPPPTTPVPGAAVEPRFTTIPPTILRSSPE